jgi:hypothetical protein
MCFPLHCPAPKIQLHSRSLVVGACSTTRELSRKPESSDRMLLNNGLGGLGGPHRIIVFVWQTALSIGISSERLVTVVYGLRISPASPRGALIACHRCCRLCAATLPQHIASLTPTQGLGAFEPFHGPYCTRGRRIRSAFGSDCDPVTRLLGGGAPALL